MTANGQTDSLVAESQDTQIAIAPETILVTLPDTARVVFHVHEQSAFAAAMRPERLHGDWHRGITLASAMLPETHMATMVTEAKYIVRHQIVDNGPSLLNQYFDWRRVTEKSMRAGTGSIGAGLENYHQVARMGDRQFHSVGKQIERRT